MILSMIQVVFTISLHIEKNELHRANTKSVKARRILRDYMLCARWGIGWVRYNGLGSLPITKLEWGTGIYRRAKLRTLFNGFEEIEMRRMKDAKKDEDVFGVSALWAALFRKR